MAGQLVSTGINEALLRAQTQRMIDVLALRGPDGEGVWSDPDTAVVLGHRRLAIIDVSPAGAQPMTSASQRWVITYNGEIYNHRELRRRLSPHDPPFRGTSDTETLLACFDAWGIETTLQRTNGMFAFAVWDRRDRRLTLARDRLGEKPLYWTNDGLRLAFCSELKGLVTLPDFDRTVDETAVANVLATGFVPSPHTIYRSTAQLEPGCLVEARVEGGRINAWSRPWWSLRDTVAANHREQRPRSMRDAVEELDALMSAAVAERLMSDVPLGAFLSGGVDSTLVAALAQRALGAARLKTFTVKMPDAIDDESPTAELVAKHLGTDHTVVELSEADMLQSVPTLATVWDEPFADPSMIPSLMLCRAARRELTVCLAGDGGDELFAGYNRHALGQSITRHTRWMPAPVRRGAGAIVGAVPPRAADAVNAAFGRVLPQRWRLPHLGTKLHKAGTLLSGDSADAWRSLAGVWPRVDITRGSEVVPPSAPNEALTPTEHLMWIDTAVVLPDNMLVKLDRASMASSLEVRVPFLSPDVLAWSWRQPMDLKTQGGVGKRVVRELLDTMVPPGIAGRPKTGFDPPLASWLRGPLRPWADDLLAAPRCVSDGWMSADALRRTWREHQSGTRNWDYRLWSVLMLESWFRGQPPP